VRAVVLLGPTTDPRLRSWRGLTGRWLRTALAEPPRHWPLVVAQWLRTGPRAMAALFRALAPDRLDARLARLEVPVVVARGDRDRLCDADWARRVAAAAPRGRLVEIPGAAHMTVQTHPAAVAAVLRSVLSEVS
jgi:pimeloyl-ACP methyl ester carboxylesterase